MRVAWIQDNSRPHGGAETSNRCVVATGERLGFDIVGITPENFHPRILEECDVAVVNNFFQFEPAQVRMVLDTIWNQKKPYVKYEHDSRELGRTSFSKRLFCDSALNVFLSPAHYRNHHEKLGCKGIVLPLAIDVETFRPVAKVERDPRKALIVGGWRRGGKTGSSLHKYIEAHRSLSFVSVGFEFPMTQCIPHVPLREMPVLYSSTGWLIHLPDMVCAGERVFFEAALCGCRVVANENVGHLSWKRDLADTDGLRAWLRQAPYDFWKAVHSVVREGVRA
jgi:hypothetical protein